MPLIRLTQKLQKEKGLKPSDFSDVESPDQPLAEWYAHLYLLDRSKQVMFVETQTLFSFTVPNVSRDEIRYRLPELFIRWLKEALVDEGAREAVLSKVLEACQTGFTLANTSNRRTLGAINEFIRQHKFGYKYQSQPVNVRDRVNRDLIIRGFPGSDKYHVPIEVFAKMLKEHHGLDFEPRRKTAIYLHTSNE